MERPPKSSLKMPSETRKNQAGQSHDKEKPKFWRFLTAPESSFSPQGLLNMCRPATFSLEKDTVMLSYSDNVANYCTPFSCGDSDLDDFFQKDALLYDREYLGRTYAWIDQSVPSQIVGMITLANDSIKARYITTSSARNRLPKEHHQRQTRT